MAWFSYDPTEANGPLNPNNYQPEGSQPTCTGTYDLCAIQTTADGSGKPQITNELRDEMVLALSAHASETNVKLKD